MSCKVGIYTESRLDRNRVLPGQQACPGASSAHVAATIDAAVGMDVELASMRALD